MACEVPVVLVCECGDHATVTARETNLLTGRVTPVYYCKRCAAAVFGYDEDYFDWPRGG